jgi:hypothetical protein
MGLLYLYLYLYAIPPFPLWAFVTCSRVNFALNFTEGNGSIHVVSAPKAA